MTFGKGIISRVTLCRCRSCRIARVKVPDNDFLAALFSYLANKVVVAAVRRSHKCRRDTDETLESLFDAPHLVVNLVKGQSGQIFVRPCMRGDLVSFVVDVLDALNALVSVNTPVYGYDRISEIFD